MRTSLSCLLLLIPIPCLSSTGAASTVRVAAQTTFPATESTAAFKSSHHRESDPSSTPTAFDAELKPSPSKRHTHKDWDDPESILKVLNRRIEESERPLRLFSRRPRSKLASKQSGVVSSHGREESLDEDPTTTKRKYSAYVCPPTFLQVSGCQQAPSLETALSTLSSLLALLLLFAHVLSSHPASSASWQYSLPLYPSSPSLSSPRPSDPRSFTRVSPTAWDGAALPSSNGDSGPPLEPICSLSLYVTPSQRCMRTRRATDGGTPRASSPSRCSRGAPVVAVGPHASLRSSSLSLPSPWRRAP